MLMIKRLSPDVILLHLSDLDSNVYLIGDTVIDSGTGFNFTRLRDFMRALKRELGDVKQVVNTHYHFDHIGGNGYFTNAKVAIHANDAAPLEAGDGETVLADYFDGNMNPKKVDRKLKHGDVIKAGKLSLEVLHTPGHTPGSICLYDKKSGALFTGDTLFPEGVGRTDFPGGNPSELQKSLQILSKLKVKSLMPGHGNPVMAGADKAIKNVLKAMQVAEERV